MCGTSMDMCIEYAHVDMLSYCPCACASSISPFYLFTVDAHMNPCTSCTHVHARARATAQRAHATHTSTHARHGHAAATATSRPPRRPPAPARPQRARPPPPAAAAAPAAAASPWGRFRGYCVGAFSGSRASGETAEAPSADPAVAAVPCAETPHAPSCAETPTCLQHHVRRPPHIA